MTPIEGETPADFFARVQDHALGLLDEMACEVEAYLPEGLTPGQRKTLIQHKEALARSAEVSFACFEVRNQTLRLLKVFTEEMCDGYAKALQGLAHRMRT